MITPILVPSFLAASPAAAPPAALILPFVLLLLAIALAPIFLRHHWERHYHKLAFGLGAFSLSYYGFVLHRWGTLEHIAHEYVSFVVLLGSLFIVSGGIQIVLHGEARPGLNCLLLLCGALLANLIGTTGASMLLIRPWIRMNRRRFAEFHTVFFIFIVSNVGGCLTPIGDPPLFLGFLKGVPFWWVLQHCWPAWLIAVPSLLAIFYWQDRADFQRAAPTAPTPLAEKKWEFRGLPNFAFLALILAAIFVKAPLGAREALMIVAALGSYFSTPRAVHQANEFNFAPIREVAWLFFGIFATMQPALDFLQLHAGALGLETATQYYWLTGALSGTLDNAPTYLTFLVSACAANGLNLENPAHLSTFLATQHHQLMAVSLGAVFFGALTYIGNGPNLMVKSIIEAAGAKTPGFFGYFAKFSLPMLVPILWLVGILFFSRWRIF